MEGVACTVVVTMVVTIYVDNRGVVRVGGRRWRRKNQRPMMTFNLYF